MTKWKKKKLEKLARRRAMTNLALAHAGLAKLALTDDAGIEKAIRKVWNWANDQLPQQDAKDVIGALQALQGKASESIDILSNLVGVALDPFPEPALTSRAGRSPALRSDDAAARAARSDEVARELLKDPAVRRGYEAAQKSFKDGTWGLSDEQRQLTARIGITDRDALAKLSAATVKAQATASASGAPSRASGASELTPWQIKVARRLGITDPDPKKIQETADAMRSGAGVVIELPKAAAA